MGLVVFRRLVITSAAFALFCVLPPSYAQQVSAPPRDPAPVARDWTNEVPAHLATIDGSVTLERDGRLEPAEVNLALMAGDRIRTQSGRVEIRFEDGSALYLDESAQLDLLGDGLARLLEGQLRLAIARATTSLEYRIDTPAASVWIRAAGEYRVDAYVSRENGSEVDLTVVRGTAELENDHGRTTVRAGQHAVASINAAPTRAYASNSAAWDEFDEWTEDQREVSIGTVSTRYLPDNVRYYSAAFDQHGSWDYYAPYGNVWYPRVAPGWRPYSHGRWSFTAHFGWMWVGIDRWSWPTHHYGSWGISAGGWYWIPGRSWAPAWVAWGGAPGYVSWCPIGYNGRPVVGFYAAGGYAYNPWNAWTIVPARVFGPGLWVTQHAVAHHRIAPDVRSQFAERPGAPRLPTTTSARNLAPVRAPTAARSTAVPRRAVNDGAWQSEMRGNSPRPSRLAAPATSSGTGPASASPAAARAAVVPRTWETDATTSAGSSSAGPIIHRGTPGSAGPQSAGEPRADDRGAVGRTRATVPSTGRVEAPRVGSPRASARAPIGAAPAPSASAPPVTIYRGRPAPPTAQPTEDRPSPVEARTPSRRAPSNEAARPSAPPSPQTPPERSDARGQAVDRSSPPRTSAPPSATPPSAGSPPSRSRGGEPTPPPSAAPAPSRGGEPRAVPRARGGSGGN